jgi:hypothetical protein
VRSARNSTGLARAGGHDQQGLALLLGECGIDGADGMVLVMPLDDGRVDDGLRQRLSGMPTVNEQPQLVTGEKSRHLARRVAGGVVPQPVLVAVGVEDHRAAAERLLQAVGVELGLLLAHLGTLGGAFGLDHRQRQPVAAPQHVVDVSLAAVRWHAGDLELPVARFGQWPARLGEQQVDEGIPGFGFGVVAGVDGLVGRLGGGDLGDQLGDVGVLGGEVFVFGRERPGVGGVLGFELLGQGCHFLAGERGGLACQCRVEHRLHRHRSGIG